MEEDELLTESLGLQMDGANNSENDNEDETYVYKMTDDDADVDRPNFFTSTQDYLVCMSEASFEKDQDLPGLVDLIEDDVDGNFNIDYIKAKVKESEGKIVFSIGEKEQIQEECCLFPHAHKDLRELREHGTYRGLAIGALLRAPLHEGTRSGRRQQGINVLLNIIKNV